jgi:hypothetical protein
MRTHRVAPSGNCAQHTNETAPQRLANPGSWFVKRHERECEDREVFRKNTERTVDVEDRNRVRAGDVHAVHGGTVVAASAGMQPDANGKVEACRTKVKLSFKYEGS